MPATTGLAATASIVRAKPRIDNSRLRAHSTETVTSVHSSSELKTITRDAEGIDASPSVTFVSGMPSSTMLAKMPPMANTDCAAPSRRNSVAAITRPNVKTTTQPPKYAISRRASTGGSREKSLIRRNRNAGMATEKTKRVSASDAVRGQRPQCDSA